ncbi:MAG: hypothetical protein ORN53_09085 [Crocinitomicaceae bacterium]|nr:hypothetical protein [Crocinitomicaceae bacterium]
MEKNNPLNQYPLSVWVLTILLTPIVMVLILVLTEQKNVLVNVRLLPAFWGIGMLLSSPYLLIFILSNRFIERLSLSDLAKKIIFGLIGASCIILTFAPVGSSFAIILSISYSPMFFILSLVMRRESIKPSLEDESN